MTARVKMATRTGTFMLLLIVLAFNGVLATNNHHGRSSITVKRSDFPADFIFGTASAAYQYEGAANEEGRGPSIWDTFSERSRGKVKDGSNGSVANDFYHRYKDDVSLMSTIGFAAFRFSISWSRILPRGNLQGGINQKGIEFYNNLIDELLANGITPFVTLWHWDTPQGLEDAYGGFLDARIANDFKDYAEVCFREFGDRVKHWITLNEPLTVTTQGYSYGVHAPGRCSKFVNPNCTAGDSSTEPYISGHNMLLAHAAAVKIYRDKYQDSQQGKIGITLNSAWSIPYSDSYADREAAARAMAFSFDWFMEPLVTGNYPADMINYVKERLPRFSGEQSAMLKGSFDFVGINYYSSNYALDTRCQTVNISYNTDSCAITTAKRNGVSIGPMVGLDWLHIYPRGIRDLLLYAKYKYKDPIIYITENGVDEVKSKNMLLNDRIRVSYYARHLEMIKDAISVGANVKGYFAWSFLDNFEWAEGYSVRFGLVHVDYKDQKRYLKRSAKWFKKFMNGK